MNKRFLIITLLKLYRNIRFANEQFSFHHTDIVVLKKQISPKSKVKPKGSNILVEHLLSAPFVVNR